jgi:regulator of replication initiation timing
MTERWTDERLDRFAANTERAIASHDAEIADLRQSLREMIGAVNRTANIQTETFAIVREMQSEVRAITTEIRTIAAEVRGLQTENRRILDRVFGEEAN